MNVTPLVDVVLVLLIIFMVVAPQLERDVQVDLPGIFNPDPDSKTDMEPLKVSVAKKGEYYLDQEKLDLDATIDRLGTEHASDPTRRLVLRADEKLHYGDVRELLARAQQVGFPGLALMVGEKHKYGATTPTAAPAAATAPADPAAPADTGAPVGAAAPPDASPPAPSGDPTKG
jgi:biopolymer transport protein ExbD/biopolymer transport protein TolR